MGIDAKTKREYFQILFDTMIGRPGRAFLPETTRAVLPFPSEQGWWMRLRSSDFLDVIPG
jgi:hypothetical protein